MAQECLRFAIVFVILSFSFGSQLVGENHPKYLVSIIFTNKHNCIGALVGRVTVATSIICMERFNFASRLYEKPCKVYAGIEATVGQDMGVWRYCVGNQKLYKVEQRTDDPFGIFPGSDESIAIEIDLPFDHYVVTKAAVGRADFNKGDKCSVYGYIAESKNTTGGTGKSANATAGNTKKALYVTNAEILKQDQCETDYREYMDRFIPDGYFCVLEGGIPDEGRILVCKNKVVGVVADDMAIVKRSNKTLYAYTYVRGGSFSARYPSALILFVCFILNT